MRTWRTMRTCLGLDSFDDWMFDDGLDNRTELRARLMVTGKDMRAIAAIELLLTHKDAGGVDVGVQ